MTALGFIGMVLGFLGCFISAHHGPFITKTEKIFSAIFWFSVPFFVGGIASKLWEAMP